jgi:hypothetical protein
MIDWPLPLQVIAFVLVAIILLLPPILIWKRYRLPVLSLLDRLHWFQLFTTVTFIIVAYVLMSDILGYDSNGHQGLLFVIILVYPTVYFLYRKYRKRFFLEIDAYRKKDIDKLQDIAQADQIVFKATLITISINILLSLLTIGVLLVI